MSAPIPLAAGAEDPTVKVIVGVVIAIGWIIAQVAGALKQKGDKSLPPSSPAPPDRVPSRRQGAQAPPSTQTPLPPGSWPGTKRPRATPAGNPGRRVAGTRPPPVPQRRPVATPARPTPARPTPPRPLATNATPVLPTVSNARTAKLAADAPTVARPRAMKQNELVAALLRPRNLRRSFVLTELLAPPLALRPPTDAE